MKKAADQYVHGEQHSRELSDDESVKSTIFAAGIATCGQRECEEKSKPCEPDDAVRRAGV